MKCGDKGFKTKAGEPCQQPINAQAGGCLHHDPRTTPEHKRLVYLKGGIASKMRQAMPEDYKLPEFEDEASILALARALTHSALVDDVDLRRISEAIKAATLALSALSARTQRQLVDTLLQVEAGGGAFFALRRLQEGLADNRPRRLPGASKGAPDHLTEEEET